MSLKAKALQYLAQRDHSRQELRLKLLRWQARAAVDSSAASSAASSATPSATAVTHAAEVAADGDASQAAESCEAQVDALLSWLVDKDLLSDERFAQSRVHARQTRFGNRRITGELRQHGVTLDEDQLACLHSSEAGRAERVLASKFSSRSSAQEQLNPNELQRLLARQQRFLAARGFSSDAIRQALKSWRSAEPG